jgi:HK97 family phage prohead protease
MTETEIKGWLPEGITQGDLDDGDFAWLSDAYKRGDEPTSKGRKLPYKIHSTVNEAGWKAAWSRAHSMDDADFEGGPSRAAVLAKLKKDKPAGIEIADEAESGKSARQLPPAHPASTAAAASTSTPAPGPAREYKTFSFKAGDTAGLNDDEFQGYLAIFNVIDDGGDVILPGAFANTLGDFLRDGVVCWQHDWATPIGRWLEAREDAHGLFVKGKISLTTAGKDALILLRDGVVKKLSIGYEPKGYRILSDAEGIALVGQAAYDAALRQLPFYRDGVRALTDVTLYEGSPVSIPMMPLATITGVKEGAPHAGLSLDAHFSAVLAANGEYVARMKALADLRRKEGRMLSAANREKLEQMKDSLAEHLQMLDDLLDAALAADPAEDPPDDDATDATDAGKSAPAPAHPTPAVETEQKDAGPSPEELRAEARREQLRFLALDARCNGVPVALPAPGA